MTAAKVRLSANISREEDDFLRRYAARKAVSLTSAVERAIASLDLISGAQDRGAAIKVGEPDGRLREVLFMC